MAEKKQEPVFNSAGTHVYVKNPETGGEWECPADYLEVALARGWELAEPVDTSLDGLFDEGTAPAKKSAAKKSASKSPGA